jgi:DNA-binding NtrC family response regulator
VNASVLILDGDRWQRETLAAALAYEGWHAEHMGDAATAMALLARHRFQLVLIDPSAPATGGWETIERLVLLYPRLPVIVLAPSDAAARSASLTGASGVIRKPMDFRVLRSAIERALSIPAETFIVRCIERGAAPTRHVPDANGTTTPD